MEDKEDSWLFNFVFKVIYILGYSASTIYFIYRAALELGFATENVHYVKCLIFVLFMFLNLKVMGLLMPRNK